MLSGHATSTNMSICAVACRRTREDVGVRRQLLRGQSHTRRVLTSAKFASLATLILPTMKVYEWWP